MEGKISFKKSLVLLSLFLCLVSFAKAQYPLPIKEEFDKYSYLRIFQNSNPNNNYNPCDLLANEVQKPFGDVL